MLVSCFEQSYNCSKAIRYAESATLYLTDGGIVEFHGMSESAWENFKFDGGAWETMAPNPTDAERLDALESAMLAMIGGIENV